MPWQQLIARVDADFVPALEALLEAAGASAVSLGDAADVPVLEPAPGETPLWPRVTVTALFDAGVDLRTLRDVLAGTLGGGAEWRIEDLPEAAWRAAGTEGVAPRRIGRRLWLLSADDALPEPGVEAVRLNMGVAFGTGRHPTTALCLEWLESELEPDRTVLDFGCGSGVLALAALRLGASAAWAVDNDPQALVAAERNAALNSVGSRLWLGPPEALPDVAFDLVLANVLARPLIDRADYFADRLKPGGRIVLSGVLRDQRAEVLAAYVPRFEKLSVAERDGWLRVDGWGRSS